MKSIRGVKDCYGCGVCATICAKGAIEISLNDKGFYVPVLYDALCTGCGLCAQSCAFLHDTLALQDRKEYCYGAFSKNAQIREKCSSGGVGFEIGRYLLDQGYKICSVRYNEDRQRAEHFIATNINEFLPSIGSKYIQSYTLDAFKAINRKEKWLITGTPCQIDSFRRYLRLFKAEHNFVLMDFFCHSVPSMLAWNKYLQLAIRKTGKVKKVSWRDKRTGWHDSWAMVIEGERESFCSHLSHGDLFYKLFLGDYCCNRACEKDCKYKYRQSSADIRVGDFWGKTFAKDEKGVSAVVAFTKQGNEIIKSLDCCLVEYPFEIVAEGQMQKNVGKAVTSHWVMHALKSMSSTENTFKRIFLIEAVLNFIRRIINKFKRILWEKS